jgi:hypothetical protein
MAYKKLNSLGLFLVLTSTWVQAQDTSNLVFDTFGDALETSTSASDDSPFELDTEFDYLAEFLRQPLKPCACFLLRKLNVLWRTAYGSVSIFHF